MSTVVVVGPATVTASVVVDPELAQTALDCIDDRLAVLDDEILPVDELWRRIADATEPARVVTLVVPAQWSAARVERIEGALLTTCADVVVRRRADVLRALAPAVVELSDTASIPDGILASVGGAATVVLDIPTGVRGLEPLAIELERRLERRGVDVIRADDETVRRVAGAEQVSPRRRFDATRLVAVVAALTIIAVLAGVALRAPPDAASDDAKWIFEGRVAVEVGAEWTVSRIVNGPGSARVQVVSPDGAVVLHLTQAAVPPQETREGTARALDAALGRQPAGVFADFDPAASVAGRDAVTYREVRSGIVDWTVVVEDGVRIAIGCLDGTVAPRRAVACERAIRTARTVDGIDGR